MNYKKALDDVKKKSPEVRSQLVRKLQKKVLAKNNTELEEKMTTSSETFRPNPTAVPDCSQRVGQDCDISQPVRQFVQ